jgi:hypothetical protein
VLVRTQFKRAWLVRQAQLADATLPAAITLRAQIAAQLGTLVDAISSGSAIAATSGNGHSVAFSTPGSGGPGPDGMAELAEEMLVRHDRAAAALAIATPASGDNDDILAQMLAALFPAREIRTSNVGLRYTA